MRSALVTGCAGFVGSHISEALLKAGNRVIGIDALTDYYSREIKINNISELKKSPRFVFHEANLNNVDLDEMLTGVDVVFHQAGQPGVRSSWGTSFGEYIDNNISCSQRLLEAAKRQATPPKIVYASSSSVYGEATEYPTTESALPRPKSPYGVSKLSAEHLFSLYSSNFGLDTVSLRYFTVYGPRQRPDMAFTRFISAALDGAPIRIFGDGRQQRDFTYISDIVSANLLAASSKDHEPGAIFNISGGSVVTVNEVLELVQSATGNSLNIVREGKVDGDVRRTHGDNRSAKQYLDWAPQTSLSDGIQAQVRWLESTRITN